MGADVGWEQKLEQVFDPREEKWRCSQGHKVLAHRVEIWGSSQAICERHDYH